MIRQLVLILIAIWLPYGAAAQDTYWLQIEARQTLTSAQDRAREYAGQLDNVAGFYLGSGWYGIFIGPFSETDARLARNRLLARRAIPSDSFVNDGVSLRQQFWPIGGGTTAAAIPPPAGNDDVAELPADPIAIPDETPQQARASERLLSREEREELQVMLQWAGFYAGAIDGSFGRGTRGSMQAWQEANNQEPTGILTTGQRQMLLDQYNSVLDGMRMRIVRDDTSGIRMLVPTGVVEFSAYKPPFVQFDATGEVPAAKVIFISQEGDEGRLVGLYEILQILDVVPPEGPRNRTRDGFIIEGIGDGIHSYTTVSLQDGALKGFMLVWPQGDEQRRLRILDEMRESFEWLDGVLDPSIAPPGEDQAIDMVSGLTVRQPKFSRSGFYVSSEGAVVTSTTAVESCERITFDREYDAEIVFRDAELGLAILRPVEPLSPIRIASFLTAVPRLQDQIAVAGYPFGGVLSAPTLTFGEVDDIRNLDGDNRVKRLSILPQEGDAGGPVFSESGAVIGMLLPRMDAGRQLLPAEVNFALDAQQVVDALEAQGIIAATQDSAGPISPVELTRRAADVTALVSCW